METRSLSFILIQSQSLEQCLCEVQIHSFSLFAPSEECSGVDKA